MVFKKRLSLLLSFILIFSMFGSSQIAFAVPSQAPYYGIDVSSGHSGAYDIAISSDDKFYVSEYTGGKIIKMDKTGDNKTTFFSPSSQPLGISFDSSNNLYIAEHQGSKVIKVDTNANASTIFNAASYLTGITKDSNDKLFVVDYTNGKIIKMNLDGSGSSDFATGLETVTVIGLTIDSNNNLYMSSYRGSKVIKIEPNGTKSDFITDLGGIREVKVGKDGFLYVPNATNKTIDKYDLTGNKIDSFYVNSSNIWAIEVDIDGSIYFSDGSYIRRLIGSADTIDRTHIKLKLNKDMVDGPADPTAFTISGAASNPQVTSAVVTGSEITLTLDNTLSALDTALKLNYAQTGTNDLTVSENSLKFSDFSNMPVANKVLKVSSVANISQINVVNGTPLNEIQFTTNAMLTLSDSTTTSAAITWDNGNPEYNGYIAGTYAFTGTFNVDSDNLSNPNNLKAHVNVAVGEVPKPNIDSIAPISDITVSKGTAVGSIGLPSYVNVNLSSSITTGAALTTTGAAVTWDINASSYNPNVVGTYVFTGNIDASPDFLNPGDLKAMVNVIVRSSSSGGSTENPPENKTEDKTIVKINNESFKIGNEEVKLQNGVKTVEVSILKNNIDKLIDENAKKDSESPNVIEINVSDKTAINAKIGLTGDIVKKLEDNNFSILINRDNVAYSIPANMFDVNDIANRMSLSSNELGKIKFEVQINKYTSNQTSLFNQQIITNNAQMLINPVEFKISAVREISGSLPQTIEINMFTNYVDRIFTAPQNINSSNISTGIVFNSDYSYSPVPTSVFTENNTLYVKIKSLTNSTYSVINNPATVKMPQNHWATPTVNTMNSKLILSDPTNFDPNKKITRAELAEYLTRSLGIYRTDGINDSKFKDVDKDNPHFVATMVADNWKLISGYPDGTFRPDALVTREEAIAMYSNAMDIAKIQNIGNSTSKLDSESTSSWAYDAIVKVTNAGIFGGRNSKSLDLKQNLTHAEALAAIEKLLDKAELD